MIFRSIFCVFLSIFLVGCPLSERVYLSNDENENVTIILGSGEKITWFRSETMLVSDNHDGDISWEDLVWVGNPDVEYRPLLSVECNSSIRNYDLSDLYGRKEISDKSGRTLTYQLHLKSNCVLVAIGKDKASENYILKPWGS